MRERIFYSRGLNPLYTTGRVWDYNMWTWNYPTIPYWSDLLITGMVDVVTDNFKRRQRQGEIINNPLWKFVFALKQTKMRLSCEGQCKYYVRHELEVAIPSKWMPNSADTWRKHVDNICDPFETDSVVAQTKAWANIDVSEIQSVASLGELPETVKMLISLLKKAIRLTLAVKRGNLVYVRKELEDVVTIDGIADLWLGYRYGIRPLMGEIKGLLAAISKQLDVSLRFTAKGKTILEPEKTVSSNNRAFGDYMGNYFGVEYKETIETSRSFRAGVLVQLDQKIDQLDAIWGLDSPIEGVWELIPFSFIIDWFLNIGDCLSAALQNPALSPLGSWVTEKIQYSQLAEAVTTLDIVSNPTSCWVAVEKLHPLDDWCTTNLIYSVMRRVPKTERFNLPRISLKLDWAKLTDLTLIARKLL